MVRQWNWSWLVVGVVVGHGFGLSAQCLTEPSGFGGGTGTVADPYHVCAPAHLQSVANHLNAHFVQTADIDMMGSSFSPIALTTLPDQVIAFRGTFDGAGYSIVNLTTTVPPNSGVIGLFGKIGETGIVRNVHLENATITGTSCVGGIAAENRGRIERCSVTGTISGSTWVGGVVGDNRAQVVDTCSRAAVSGVNSIGGLIGTNFRGSPPAITRCYASGPVTASSIGGGGLIGTNIGTTPVITASYWDLNTTGQATSGGGAGRTHAQMLLAATYVGWDFVTAWCIDEGNDTPRNDGCMTVPPSPQFRRGDANVDGSEDISDAVKVLGVLFLAESAACDSALDANDDGAVNIADAVTVLGYLFPQGPAVLLPPPAGGCGVDPTPDALDCADFPPCPGP
ncbi:MAG: GLUG motif-containing protein [Planctomycetota bacterium]